MTVAPDAESRLGRYVQVKYQNCYGYVLAMGAPETNVTMSEAIGVLISTDCNDQLTHINDKAIVFGTKSACQLTVHLSFPSKNFFF